jgi:hypothetical protein
MTEISRVERWFTSMDNLGQADTPFAFGNITMTPRQLLSHAKANDSVWQQVQQYI